MKIKAIRARIEPAEWIFGITCIGASFVILLVQYQWGDAGIWLGLLTTWCYFWCKFWAMKLKKARTASEGWHQASKAELVQKRRISARSGTARQAG